MSSIPPDSIYSVTLKLFSDKYSTFYPAGHQYLQYFPRNDLIIQRITEDWEEYKVNWINRPDVNFENEMKIRQYIKNTWNIDRVKFERENIYTDVSEVEMLNENINVLNSSD